MKKFLICLGYSATLIASPAREIPPELYNDYTLGGKIPVHYWYFDGVNTNPIIFTAGQIDKYIEQVKQGGVGSYFETDQHLYILLNRYASSIMGKKVGIIGGSSTPWYESIVLAYGGTPVTIDNNKIICEDSRVRTMTVDEFNQNPETFDALISISIIEHFGLGRYGDALNPKGDLNAMKWMKSMLTKDGLLFLSVPIGQDCIWWNAHRVYGMQRFPLLIEGWRFRDASNFTYKDLSSPVEMGYQPVFVLSPKN